MLNTPQIQAEAIIDLVLDGDQLSKKLKAAIGASVKEAAGQAKLGDQLANATSLKKLRAGLQQEFKGFSKVLAEGISDDILDEVNGAVKSLRRQTVDEFNRDLQALRSKTGRPKSEAGPQVVGRGNEPELMAKLDKVVSAFGAERLRVGISPEDRIRAKQAAKNAALLDNTFRELSNLPKVSRETFRQMEKVIADKTGKAFDRLSNTDRERVARGSQTLSLETAALNRLAKQLSRAGAGSASEEILTALGPRRKMLGQLQASIDPTALRKMAEANAEAGLKVARTNRKELIEKAKLEERARIKAGAESQKAPPGVFRPRRYDLKDGKPVLRPGLAASLGLEDRVAYGLPSSQVLRAPALAQVRARRTEEERTQSAAQAAGKLESVAQRLDRQASEQREREIRQQGLREVAASNYNERLDAKREADQRREGLREVAASNYNERLDAKREADQRREGVTQAKALREDTKLAVGRSKQDLASRLLAGYGNNLGAINSKADLGDIRTGVNAEFNRLRDKLTATANQYGKQSDEARAAAVELEKIRKLRAGIGQRVKAIDAATASELNAQKELTKQNEAIRQNGLRMEAAKAKAEQAALDAQEKYARDLQKNSDEMVERFRKDELRRTKLNQQADLSEARERAAGARSGSKYALAQAHLAKYGDIGSIRDKAILGEVGSGLDSQRTNLTKQRAIAEDAGQKQQVADIDRQLAEIRALRKAQGAQLQSVVDSEKPPKEPKAPKAEAARGAEYRADELLRTSGGLENLKFGDQLNSVIKGLTAKATRLDREIAEAAKALDAMGDAAEGTQEALDRAAKQAMKASLELERINVGNELNNASNQRKEMGQAGFAAGGSLAAGAGASAGLDHAGNIVKNFGYYALGFGSLYAITNQVIALKDAIVELDKAFFSIKAVTQATDREMLSISKSIRDVALNTNFSTTEIAAGAKIVGQAGVAPDEIGKVLSATANFASATESSLEVAADLLTTVRKVFEEVDESTIADQLTKAVNVSKLNSEDLKTILSLTGQTADSYNVNLEQLLGASSTLRNAGIKPSTIATGLRQAMLEVFNPDTATTKALSARYKQLGETGAEGKPITDAEIQQRFFGFTNAENPLVAALTELKRIGFADEGQVGLQRGFDIRAFNAIQGLISNFEELQASSTNISFGQAAREGADIQLMSLSASMENLGASIVVLTESISDGLVRTLAGAAQSATQFITSLTELDAKMKAGGADGLGGIFGGVASGALAGVVAGKGAKGKLISGLIGGVAGGYLDGGRDIANGLDGNSVSAADVAGVAAIVATLATVVQGIRGLSAASSQIEAAADIGGGALKTLSVGSASKIIGKIGTRFVPFIGWALLALDALSIVADLIPEGDGDRLRNMAAGASAQAEDLRKKFETKQALAAEYDVNAPAGEVAEGTTAAAFGGYRQQLINFQGELESTFGQMTTEKTEEVTKLLREYANTAESGRGAVRDRLSAALGTAVEQTDKTLFDLGSSATSLSSTVDVLVQNTRSALLRSMETISAARASGADVPEKDALLSEAFAKDSQRLGDIFNGTTDLNSEEVGQAINDLYANYHELLITTPKDSAEVAAAEAQSLTATLANELSFAADAGEITRTVSLMASGLNSLHLTVKQRVEAMLAGIDQAKASVAQQREEILENTPSKKESFTDRLFLRGAPIAPRKATPEEEAATAALLQNNSDMSAQLGKDRARLEAQVERQEKYVKTQNDGYEKQATDKLLGQLNAVLSDPAVVKELSDPTQASGILPNYNDRGLIAQLIADSQKTSPEEAVRARVVGVPDREGLLQNSAEYTGLSKSLQAVLNNTAAVAAAQKKTEEARASTVPAELVTRQIRAETAVAIAKSNKDYGSLTSDSESNPIIQKWVAEGEKVAIEIKKAEFAIKNSKDKEGTPEYIGKVTKLEQLKAEQATLDIRKKAELEQVRAEANSNAETVKRKSDAELARKSKIALVQTGLDAKVIKQDFEDSIRTGDLDEFLKKSNEYIDVQARMREELKVDLAARGYTNTQIEAEINLRDELNKPLAEQVENIRKLSAARLRDLEIANVQNQRLGTGPDVGGIENSAYLEADGGFTREEQAAAANRDVKGYALQIAALKEELQQPYLQGDEVAIANINKQLDTYQEKLGKARASYDQMTQSAEGAIDELFDPRKFTIALEQTGFLYATMGDNLRSTLVSALDDAADAMARLVIEGGDVKDVLQEIINQAATEGLATMFKSNLNEGLAILAGGSESKDGTKEEGLLGKASDALGLTELADSVGGWFSGLFGGDETPAAAGSSTPGAASSNPIAEALGMGGGSSTAAASMNVSAGVVTVSGTNLDAGLDDLGGKAAEALGTSVPDAVATGMKEESKGFFSSLSDGFSGLFDSFMSLFSSSGGGGTGGGGGGMMSSIMGMFGGGGAAAPTGADIGASAQQYGPEVAKMGGTAPAAPAAGAAASGGSITGALGGAGMGYAAGGAIGGAIGGKKGSKWGAIAGALLGAYFGFGMADGGAITKLGMVRGSGRRGVDSVPVAVKGSGQRGLLAPGEGVLSVKAMDALGGESFVHAANNGKLFSKSVGGANGASYNATKKMSSLASASVRSAPPVTVSAPDVNVKNVNVFDDSAIRSALQTREGEDMMINAMKKRGALA